MMLLSIVVLLLLAAGSFVGANFLDPGPAQQSLCGLGGALVGLTLPQVPSLFKTTQSRDSQAGHGTPTLLFLLAFVGLSTFTGVALTSCKQVKPDQFFEAVVDCAKVNPEASAAAAAVLTCITSAASGNPAACLAGLVTEAHFTVDEIACVVAWIAERENQKVGTPAAGPDTQRTRDIAVDWLVRERIAVRNTYMGAPKN